MCLALVGGIFLFAKFSPYFQAKKIGYIFMRKWLFSLWLFGGMDAR